MVFPELIWPRFIFDVSDMKGQDREKGAGESKREEDAIISSNYEKYQLLNLISQFTNIKPPQTSSSPAPLSAAPKGSHGQCPGGS